MVSERDCADDVVVKKSDERTLQCKNTVSGDLTKTGVAEHSGLSWLRRRTGDVSDHRQFTESPCSMVSSRKAPATVRMTYVENDARDRALSWVWNRTGRKSESSATETSIACWPFHSVRCMELKNNASDRALNIKHYFQCENI